MSLTLNCNTHRREWYLKPSNINIVTSCGRDKFSYRTVNRLMIFHIFDIARKFLVCARFWTILIAIGIVKSVKLNGQALLIVFKIKLWWPKIVMKTLLSVRAEIAYFRSITWNDLWRNFIYFLLDQRSRSLIKIWRMAVAFLGHHFLLTFHFYKDFYTTQQAKNPSPTELFWSFQSRNQILSILLWCTQWPNVVHTSMAKMYLDKDWFASTDLVRLLCFVISIKHPFSIVYIDCRTQLYHQRIAAHLWLCQIWLSVFKLSLLATSMLATKCVGGS